jgi:hypothetical protein
MESRHCYGTCRKIEPVKIECRLSSFEYINKKSIRNAVDVELTGFILPHHRYRPQLFKYLTVVVTCESHFIKINALWYFGAFIRSVPAVEGVGALEN